MNVGGGESNLFGNTNREGLFLATTKADQDQEYFYNGSSVATNNRTDQTLTTTKMFGLACNSNGSAASFSADTSAAAWIGGGLTTTKLTNLSLAINAYMTSWGINVY
jgi:hypothetical protein